MDVIVTGINGFVGTHLASELKFRGYKVIGVGREDKPKPQVKPFLSNYARADLTKADDVANLPLSNIKSVINLAGLARVGDSFNDPEFYNRVNVEVLTVLGERLVKEGSQARVIAISTGAVYDPRQPLPLRETSKITFDNSPYAISKIKMEEAGADLRVKGLNCVIARPFNHIGPGQEPGFLVPDLYQKISGALRTGKSVEVGNLKTRRDYTDVRDVVKAYADLALAEKLEYELYNVCSSRSVPGEEILKIILELTGAKDKVTIKVNPKFIRASDPLNLYGSHELLSHETGWQPVIKTEQTIKDYADSAN